MIGSGRPHARPIRSTTVFPRALLIAIGVAGGAGCIGQSAIPPLPPASTALTIVRTDPADGAADVAVDTPIDVYLDGIPLPESIGPSAVTPRSGGYYWLGTVTVDLVRRRLRFVPRHDLYPSTGYVVTVDPSIATADGRTLGKAYSFRLRTGTTVLPAEPPPGIAFSTDIAPIFTARCVSCHQGPAAPDGLDLRAGHALDDLLGVPAVEAPDLVRVAPGDAAGSALLRKLLGVPPLSRHALPDAAVPSNAELLEIEDWIASGAPP